MIRNPLRHAAALLITLALLTGASAVGTQAD